MKLGTKILMGFAVICVIFLILTVCIFVLVRGVQTDTQEVAETILPTSIAASDILGRMALVSFYSNDYYYSSSQESHDIAVAENEAIDVQMQIMKDNFNAPAVQRNSELMSAMTALMKNYPLFYAQVEEVEIDLEAIVVARDQIRVNYTNVSNLTTEMLGIQGERIIQAASNGDVELVKSVLERMVTTRNIRDQLDTNLTALLRGQMFRARSYFEDADKASAIMLERAQWMESTSDTQQERRLANEVIGFVNNTVNRTSALSDAVILSLDHTNLRGALRDVAMKDSNDVSAFTSRQSLTRLGVVNGQLNTVILSLIVGLAVAIIISVVLGTIIIRGITKPINMLVETLSNGANQVDSASNQLTSASNTLAEGAAENAAALEETSAALEELASMSKRNADNSVEANALMNQASAAVGQATKSMVDVTKAMGEITISGNEIGKIIKTIDEIAFQTNLLALNAAVEAARAGEAGAGFAVVADEVRNLAIRSADAAKHTSDLIASTIGNINSGTEMVNATSENFTVVATHSSKVAELLAEISEASKEQFQGIGQITTAMTEMDKVTQSNAASAEQSASAATELSQQAGNLLDAVDGLNTLVHGQGQSMGGGHPQTTKAKALPRSKYSNRGGDLDTEDDFNF